MSATYLVRKYEHVKINSCGSLVAFTSVSMSVREAAVAAVMQWATHGCKQYCTIHKRIARYLKNGNIWIILSFVYKAWIDFMTLLVLFEERIISLSRQNR